MSSSFLSNLSIQKTEARGTSRGRTRSVPLQKPCCSGTPCVSSRLDDARQVDLCLGGPPRSYGDSAVKDMMIQSAIPLPPPGGCVDAGGQDFRLIDVTCLQVRAR